MDTKTLLGLSEKEAIKQIQAAGFTYRIERRGKNYTPVIDAQFVSTRIKLQIDKGKVVFAIVG